MRVKRSRMAQETLELGKGNQVCNRLGSGVVGGKESQKRACVRQFKVYVGGGKTQKATKCLKCDPYNIEGKYSCRKCMNISLKEAFKTARKIGKKA